MSGHEVKALVSELENDLMSLARSFELKIDELGSELRDVKRCVEQKNREISELKLEHAEIKNLFDIVFNKVFAILDGPQRKNSPDDLCEIEQELRSLVGMFETTAQRPVLDTPLIRAASTGEFVVEPGDACQKRAVDEPTLGSGCTPPRSNGPANASDRVAARAHALRRKDP